MLALNSCVNQGAKFIVAKIIAGTADVGDAW
jgi:hypothetical protein